MGMPEGRAGITEAVAVALLGAAPASRAERARATRLRTSAAASVLGGAASGAVAAGAGVGAVAAATKVGAGAEESGASSRACTGGAARSSARASHARWGDEMSFGWVVTAADAARWGVANELADELTDGAAASDCAGAADAVRNVMWRTPLMEAIISRT